VTATYHGAMAPASTPETESSGLTVRVDGFTGTLEELVLAAQRGDVDLGELPVAQVTTQVGRQLSTREPAGDLRQAAEALTLLSRLLALKAARVTEVADPSDDAEEEAIDSSDAGRRLAEYRLFRAAMEALLLEPGETGERSFLSLVSPEVLPVERLRIPPDRLAAAFRQVLERLDAGPPLPVGTVTFSVDEKAAWLRELLAGGAVDFDAIFAGVRSRLEAVACFLGLLDLLRRGEAVVDQPQPFGPIRVSSGG
jgi:segregation and condensation protein A